MGSKTAKRKVGKTAPKAASHELSENLWSVISFEKCEARGLNYNEAVRKMKELAAGGASGLCIVTDVAAKRITSK